MSVWHDNAKTHIFFVSFVQNGQRTEFKVEVFSSYFPSMFFLNGVEFMIHLYLCSNARVYQHNRSLRWGEARRIIKKVKKNIKNSNWNHPIFYVVPQLFSRNHRKTYFEFKKIFRRFYNRPLRLIFSIQEKRRKKTFSLRRSEKEVPNKHCLKLSPPYYIKKIKYLPP